MIDTTAGHRRRMRRSTTGTRGAHDAIVFGVAASTSGTRLPLREAEGPEGRTSPVPVPQGQPTVDSSHSQRIRCKHQRDPHSESWEGAVAVVTAGHAEDMLSPGRRTIT